MTLGIVNDASRELELGYTQFKGTFFPLSLTPSQAADHGLAQTPSTTLLSYARHAVTAGMLRTFWGGSSVRTRTVGLLTGSVQLRAVIVAAQTSFDSCMNIPQRCNTRNDGDVKASYILCVLSGELVNAAQLKNKGLVFSDMKKVDFSFLNCLVYPSASEGSHYCLCPTLVVNKRRCQLTSFLLFWEELQASWCVPIVTLS